MSQLLTILLEWKGGSEGKMFSLILNALSNHSVSLEITLQYITLILVQSLYDNLMTAIRSTIMHDCNNECLTVRLAEVVIKNSSPLVTLSR